MLFIIRFLKMFFLTYLILNLKLKNLLVNYYLHIFKNCLKYNLKNKYKHFINIKNKVKYIFILK